MMSINKNININININNAEYKVKRMSNNEWYECSAKAVVGRCSLK